METASGGGAGDQNGEGAAYRQADFPVDLVLGAAVYSLAAGAAAFHFALAAHSALEAEGVQPAQSIPVRLPHLRRG